MPSVEGICETGFASVKATQKITKPCRWSRPRKLRRAQLAAEAARPYAERLDQGFDQSRPPSIGTSGHVPRLLGGGGDTVHLLVVCTADAVFAALLIPRSRGSRARRRCRSSGKARRSKSLCVGKKRAMTSCGRQFGRQIIEVIDCVRFARSVSTMPTRFGRKIIALHKASEFDVCTFVFSRRFSR